MRTRQSWLFAGVGLSVLALAILATVTLAGANGLSLRSLTPQWTWGQEIELEIDVDGALIGGHYELYRQIEGFAPELATSGEFMAPTFVVPTQLPCEPHYQGLKISYWYDGFAPWGEPLGGSGPVMRKPKVDEEYE